VFNYLSTETTLYLFTSCYRLVVEAAWLTKARNKFSSGLLSLNKNSVSSYLQVPSYVNESKSQYKNLMFFFGLNWDKLSLFYSWRFIKTCRFHEAFWGSLFILLIHRDVLPRDRVVVLEGPVGSFPVLATSRNALHLTTSSANITPWLTVCLARRMNDSSSKFHTIQTAWNVFICFPRFLCDSIGRRNRHIYCFPAECLFVPYIRLILNVKFLYWR
jgi:hypothetical protein